MKRLEPAVSFERKLIESIILLFCEPDFVLSVLLVFGMVEFVLNLDRRVGCDEVCGMILVFTRESAS